MAMIPDMIFHVVERQIIGRQLDSTASLLWSIPFFLLLTSMNEGPSQTARSSVFLSAHEPLLLPVDVDHVQTRCYQISQIFEPLLDVKSGTTAVTVVLENEQNTIQ